MHLHNCQFAPMGNPISMWDVFGTLLAIFLRWSQILIFSLVAASSTFAGSSSLVKLLVDQVIS